jgi:MFS family permease
MVKDLAVRGAAAMPGGRFGAGWRMVTVFAVTQTIGYGCLYYSFAVLLHPVAATLHASPAAVTGAFTTAVLVWAVMTVPVGRGLDRHGGRGVMTAGALGGALLLLCWSQVHQLWQLYLVFAGLGVAMATALYDPATAVIVSWFDPQHRPRAVLTMIVVAGFASTIFMPLTGVLEARFGWRQALLVLAAIYGAVAVPLHGLLVRRPPGPTPTRTGSVRRRELVRAARRDGRFWTLAAAFLAHAAAMSVMTVHLVGFLISRGHPATFAATVAGLLGVLSVTGRLLLTGVQRRVRLAGAVAVVFTVQASAAVALIFVGGSRFAVLLAVVGFGCGFGVASLAIPQLLAERYGTAAYASIAGTLAAPVTVAKAAAPLAAAALLTATSYPAVLAAVAAACLLAAVAVHTATRPDPPAT